MEQTLLQQGDALVLVMLDNKCPSPCYCFGHDAGPWHGMSTEILMTTLDWIAGFEPMPPGVFFMVSDARRLDRQIKEFIREMADSLICPLMSTSEQERLEIPLTAEQTIVVPNLGTLERHSAVIRGRSCILHVGRADLPHAYEILSSASVQRNSLRLRMRPYEIDRWRPADLQAYRSFLAQWDTRVYRLAAGGTLPDAATVRLEPDVARCPGARSLIAIGPDGCIYPCPAFYGADPCHRLGSLDAVDRERIFAPKPAESCSLCHAPDCPACLFCRSTLYRGAISVCDVSAVRREKGEADTIQLVSRSAYLFEGLRMAKTNDARQASESEGKDLSADEHVFDVTLEDFTRALGDIRRVGAAVIQGKPTEIEMLVADWQVAPTVPGTSRKAVFYRRMVEILRGLARLPEVSQIGRQKLHPVSMERMPLPQAAGASSDRPVIEEPLSPQEVSTIRALYQRVLGWEALYAFALDACKAGFQLDGEMAMAQQETADARNRLAQWFDETARRNHWPNREGYLWEVDFESTMKVSGARARRSDERRQPEPLLESSGIAIMRLGQVDADICRRLFELRETPVIAAREYLAQAARGAPVDTKALTAAVEEIGRHDLDIRRWFHGMAREYNWPRDAAGWRVTPDYKQIEAMPGHSARIPAPAESARAGRSMDHE